MQADREKVELLELTNNFIATNKQFTDGLRDKKPHAELVEIYQQILAIYNQIHSLKGSSSIAA